MFEEQVQRVRELLAGSARRGASPDEILTAERRLGVTLPNDVRELVAAFDGSDEATPVENGWVTFWSLAAWRKVSTVPELSDSPLTDAIAFADYSLESWHYALDVGPDSTRSDVYLISGLPEQPPLVAPSLSDFLQAIIDDGEALYRRLD
jgi:cell wall assembly regulator SMI1